MTCKVGARILVLFSYREEFWSPLLSEALFLGRDLDLAQTWVEHLHLPVFLDVAEVKSCILHCRHELLLDAFLICNYRRIQLSFRVVHKSVHGHISVVKAFWKVFLSHYLPM